MSGVLGARTSPRLLLGVGLMATASVNVLFGFSSSLVYFCVLWAINGTLQVRRHSHTTHAATATWQVPRHHSHTAGVMPYHRCTYTRQFPAHSGTVVNTRVCRVGHGVGVGQCCVGHSVGVGQRSGPLLATARARGRHSACVSHQREARTQAQQRKAWATLRVCGSDAANESRPQRMSAAPPVHAGRHASSHAAVSISCSQL
jgi:hypothetical protein